MFDSLLSTRVLRRVSKQVSEQEPGPLRIARVWASFPQRQLVYDLALSRPPKQSHATLATIFDLQTSQPAFVRY